jgi:hypothetical protein
LEQGVGEQLHELEELLLSERNVEKRSSDYNQGIFQIDLSTAQAATF